MATTLVEWRARAERLATQAKRAREATREVGQRSMNVLATAGSGYAVGVAMKKYGDKPIPGTEVPMIPAAAGILAVAGVAGAAGDMSGTAAAIGGGALGGYAAIKGYTGTR
jgi:hypothetical protein